MVARTVSQGGAATISGGGSPNGRRGWGGYGWLGAGLAWPLAPLASPSYARGHTSLASALPAGPLAGRSWVVRGARQGLGRLAPAWLDRGAQQCRVVILSLWRNLPVTECQLDEVWGFIHTKQENLPGAKEYLVKS